MEFVIFWLLFGGCCFAIAKNKNRNEWVALICGILFGIFALIYYIVVDKKKVESDTSSNGDEVIPTQKPTVKPTQGPTAKPTKAPISSNGPSEPTTSGPVDETTQPPITPPTSAMPLDKK